MCSSGMPGLELVVVEDDPHPVPPAPGGLVGDARPADLQIAPRGEGPAVVELLGELRHQRGHLLAQVGVEPDLLDPEVGDAQVEPAGVLHDDRPVVEPHRCAAELDAHVAHGHDAVVEDEPAADVVHAAARWARRGPGASAAATGRPATGRSTRAAARSRCGSGPAQVGSTCTVALTSLAPDGLIVRQVFCHSPGRAVRSSSLNGSLLAASSTWTRSGYSPLGSFGAGQLVDRPAGRDDRLAVLPAHVAEDPAVGVELQPAGEVADRCTGASPR